ncbi:DUF502 domain-containing protein [Helicobacter sp. 23-1045]
MKVFHLVFKGIVAVLPIIILLWILKIIYGFFANIVDSIFFLTQRSLISTIAICVLMLLFFLILGFVVERNKEAIFLKAADLIIGKIPLISTIYATIKEIVNLFSAKGTDNYLGVVWVKIGDYKVMGFITKEMEDEYFVFIPTTPNPTSGFLLKVKKDEVEKSDLSVANGFKKLVSLGIK